MISVWEMFLRRVLFVELRFRVLLDKEFVLYMKIISYLNFFYNILVFENVGFLWLKI